MEVRLESDENNDPILMRNWLEENIFLILDNPPKKTRTYLKTAGVYNVIFEFSTWKDAEDFVKELENSTTYVNVNNVMLRI